MKVQQAPSPVHVGPASSPRIVACVTRPAEQRRHESERDASTRTSGQKRVEAPSRTGCGAASRWRGSRPPACRGRQIAPASAGAVSAVSVAHRPTSATRRLYQFMNAETMRLMDRNTRHQEERSPRSRAPTAHHRAGEDLEQLGIGHRRAERARLDDVEVLAGHRRHHDAQRLRQDDLRQHLARPQPQAAVPPRAGPCAPTGSQRARSRR